MTKFGFVWSNAHLFVICVGGLTSHVADLPRLQAALSHSLFSAKPANKKRQKTSHEEMLPVVVSCVLLTALAVQGSKDFSFLELTTLKGERTTMADYKGKVSSS